MGPVTVLVGDNGSGTSTLIEAIAVAAGFNAEGGGRNLRFATFPTHSDLHLHLQMRWRLRPRWGWFLRAETFDGMASRIAVDDDPQSGVAGLFPALHDRSHGESFLSLMASRFTTPGLYLLDEPESALSSRGARRAARGPVRRRPGMTDGAAATAFVRRPTCCRAARPRRARPRRCDPARVVDPHHAQHGDDVHHDTVLAVRLIGCQHHPRPVRRDRPDRPDAPARAQELRSTRDPSAVVHRVPPDSWRRRMPPPLKSRSARRRYWPRR